VVDSVPWPADDRPTKNANLTTVGAACAVITTLAFVVGIVLLASSGVQVLIPETGQDGLDWIRDVDDAGGQFFAGGWLIVSGGLLALLGLIGFYEPLRRAHPLLILGPILAVVGFVFVPLYAWASLRTRVVPRWIGWLGLFTAVFAGWLGLFAPAPSVIDGLTFFGFVGFFAWMAAMGIALLRRGATAQELAPLAVQG
jgi:hypothetical protein